MKTAIQLPPLEHRRKPGLGCYNGNRLAWKTAWQRARKNYLQGVPPDPVDSGLNWKASLIVNYERTPYIDPLSIPVQARLNAMRYIREITNEDHENFEANSGMNLS